MLQRFVESLRMTSTLAMTSRATEEVEESVRGNHGVRDKTRASLAEFRHRLTDTMCVSQTVSGFAVKV